MTTTPLRMADINIPITTHGPPSTKRRPILSSAPFSTAKITTDIDADLSTFSLEVTLGHLVDFLVSKLDSLYPPHLITALRRSISSHLIPKLAPTWDPLNPSSGSGVRSLIALPGKFPTPLVKAAFEIGIDPVKWTRAISETGEWEIWVDPGSVCFREGGWAFADDAFDKMYKREFRAGSFITRPRKVTRKLILMQLARQKHFIRSGTLPCPSKRQTITSLAIQCPMTFRHNPRLQLGNLTLLFELPQSSVYPPRPCLLWKECAQCPYANPNLLLPEIHSTSAARITTVESCKSTVSARTAASQ
jgi:hypothetical protein